MYAKILKVARVVTAVASVLTALFVGLLFHIVRADINAQQPVSPPAIKALDVDYEQLLLTNLDDRQVFVSDAAAGGEYWNFANTTSTRVEVLDVLNDGLRVVVYAKIADTTSAKDKHLSGVVEVAYIFLADKFYFVGVNGIDLKISNVNGKKEEPTPATESAPLNESQSLKPNTK